MSRFRKKPVEVEAVQFDGTPGGACAVFDVFDVPGAKFVPDHDLTTGHIRIPTLEGTMIADKGDWIIKEPFPTLDRQFYPCKPSIFESTYERVPDETTQPPDLG